MPGQPGSSVAPEPNRKKITTFDLQRKKQSKQPITMLTAYDYSSALLVDRADIDIILVGDSLAMVMLGLTSTVPVTMDEMLHHCRAVARGAEIAFLVGDMPFMSYQADINNAIQNAGRFLKEGAMESIKLEGGREIAATVKAIVEAGIPVMGHIGLTPQSVSKLGGYRVQGKTSAEAQRLLEDALILQDAGCYSLVLEAVPEKVAQVISHKLSIPTIGIGAGRYCDGQVLVYHDLTGLFDRFTPKFVKRYAEAGQIIAVGLNAFVEDVKTGRFPADEHVYPVDEAELETFFQQNQ